MTWRLARSLDVLGHEVDAMWPNRSRSADGTIGDASHQSRGSASDHNPNSAGVVRARDITAKGIDVRWLREHIRSMARNGHPALATGAYLISDRQIATANKGWEWRPYGGSNPHNHHMHVSVTTRPGADGYDATAGWMLAGPPHKPKEPTVPLEFDPPLTLERIVSDLPCPTGGAWLLGENGGIYAFAGAPYLGGPEGKPYWGDRKAARLEAFNGGYRVVSTTLNPDGTPQTYEYARTG